MSARVTVYTTAFCPFCVRAKSLLSQKNVPFVEVAVDRRQDLRRWIAERSGQTTVPQVFVNGAALGGFTDLVALDRKGELDPLLSRDPDAGDPETPR